MSEQVTIADDPTGQRYVLHIDGTQAGFLSYRLTDGPLALLHAEVDPALERRGLGSALVGFVLDDARRRGLAVLPHCPFVRYYIAQHPEYRDLVPETSRPRFGL
jgi:predicted GNAT family acetyltransferase